MNSNILSYVEILLFCSGDENSWDITGQEFNSSEIFVGTPKIYLGFNALSEIMHSIKMYFILFIFISKYDATTICLLIFNAKACSIQVYYCKPVTVELEGAS